MDFYTNLYYYSVYSFISKIETIRSGCDVTLCDENDRKMVEEKLPELSKNLEENINALIDCGLFSSRGTIELSQPPEKQKSKNKKENQAVINSENDDSESV